MKVMSSSKLAQTWPKQLMLQYFMHIHNANFVHSTNNYGYDAKSRHWQKLWN